MNLKIKSVKVMINTSATDTIFMEPDTVVPYPIMGYPALLKMEAQAGYGIEWVRLVFGREPDEIIDMKRNRP